MNALHARDVDADRDPAHDLRRVPAGAMSGAGPRKMRGPADDGLIDALIAAQFLEQKYRGQRRPFLAYCALQLERQLHARLDEFELLDCGWEPSNL